MTPSELRPRHWILALLVALGLHAALLAAFIETPAPGAAATGEGGVEIALGPAGSAPGSVAATAASETAEPTEESETASEAEPPQPETPPEDRPLEESGSEPLEQAELPETVPRTVEMTQVAEAQPSTPQPQAQVEQVATAQPESHTTAWESQRVPDAAIAEVVPLESEPESEQEAEAQPEALADAAAETEAGVDESEPVTEPESLDAVEAAESPVEPTPEEMSDNTPAEAVETPNQAVTAAEAERRPDPSAAPPPKPRDAPRPTPEPAPEPQAAPALQEAADTPEPAEPANAPAPESGEAETSDTAGNQGAAGSDAEDEAGDGPDSSSGGNPGAEADYHAQLLAWLERHKDYPRRAQRLRQEGTAQLRVEMDREGRVLNYEIVRSAGQQALDQAVEEMIRRADPLPPLPPEIGGERYSFTVPVIFSLR